MNEEEVIMLMHKFVVYWSFNEIFVEVYYLE